MLDGNATVGIPPSKAEDVDLGYGAGVTHGLDVIAHRIAAISDYIVIHARYRE